MAGARDISYALVRESVWGVTPATPAFVNIDYKPGNDLSFVGETRPSELMTKDRSVAASVLSRKTGGGSLKLAARRDAAVDHLLEAVCGATGLVGVDTGSIVAGAGDFSYTVEKKMKIEGVDSYHRYVGTYVNRVVFDVDQSTNGSFTADFMPKDRVSTTAAVASATYPVGVIGPEIGSNDVGVISIGAIPAALYTSAQISIEMAHEPVYVLGSLVPGQINASQQARKVMVTLTMLRSSLDIDAVAGTYVPVKLTIGTGTGNRYTFDMPNCLVNVPEDQIESGSLAVSVTLEAVRDETLGSSLKITKS